MPRHERPLTDEQREKGRMRAEFQLAHGEAWGYPAVTWDEELGVPVPVSRGYDVLGCSGTNKTDGSPCAWGAGVGTVHPGVGNCFRHEGKTNRVAGAWMMAHLIARQLDISPWDALLLTVKRAAAWSNFYESKLSAVMDDETLRPGGENHDWVVAYERVTDKLARYSKMAVDAGVAAMVVARARSEGEQIARVLNAALGAAGLTDEQETRLRSALRDALIAVEEEQRDALGETASVAGTEEPDDERA